MAHGGARPGAGRKAGSATAKTREIANKAIEDGITPLEVMLNCMRRAYEGSQFEEACRYAKDAAPYVHPRLQSSESENKVTGQIQYVPLDTGVPRG